MDLHDKMLEAQEKLNEVELIFCDLLNGGELDPDQTEDAERMVKYLEALQIQCMGIS